MLQAPERLEVPPQIPQPSPQVEKPLLGQGELSRESRLVLLLTRGVIQPQLSVTPLELHQQCPEGDNRDHYEIQGIYINVCLFKLLDRKF